MALIQVAPLMCHLPLKSTISSGLALNIILRMYAAMGSKDVLSVLHYENLFFFGLLLNKNLTSFLSVIWLCLKKCLVSCICVNCRKVTEKIDIYPIRPFTEYSMVGFMPLKFVMVAYCRGGTLSF